MSTPYRRRESSEPSEPSESSPAGWKNLYTCGWYAGEPSSPYVCESPSTCLTNTDAAVACVTDSASGLYTDCMDVYDKVNNRCISTGPQTTCCNEGVGSECGVLMWTGSPTRFLVGCHVVHTTIWMNDEPQFAIDASATAADTTNPSVSISTPSTIISSAPVSGSSAPAEAPNSVTGSPPALSVGAKAGIGSGVGVGVTVALLLALLYFRNAKARRHPQGEDAATPAPPARGRGAGEEAEAAPSAKAELEDPRYLRGQLQSGAHQGKPGLEAASRSRGTDGQRAEPDGLAAFVHDSGQAEPAELDGSPAAIELSSIGLSEGRL